MILIFVLDKIILMKQLLEIDAGDMIAKGYSYTCARQDEANKLLDKAFKIRLGRGSYGECLVCFSLLWIPDPKVTMHL